MTFQKKIIMTESKWVITRGLWWGKEVQYEDTWVPLGWEAVRCLGVVVVTDRIQTANFMEVYASCE